MMTPWSPPPFDRLATRTLSNSQCRAAVLDTYAALDAQLAICGCSLSASPSPGCAGKVAALARLRALITGEQLWEHWRRAPRERVTA